MTDQQRSTPTTTAPTTASPPRYASRLQNRFSEIESPTRKESTTPTGLKNSPLQPNRTSDYKLNENDRYASYEIKNEDRGEWRENKASVLTTTTSHSVVDEVEQVEIKKSPSAIEQKPIVVKTHATSSFTKSAGVSNTTIRRLPINTTPHRAINYQQAEQRASSQDNNHNHVPHYMQATTSFDRKAKAAREEHRNHSNDPLRRRTQGGITKRVGTAKVPRYQSTTSINAIHDIQNEMTPEDVYVPMAARIKMFERGLGNASNKVTPPCSIFRRSASSSITPSSSSQSCQQQQITRRSNSPNVAAAGNVPGYARKTVSSDKKERSTTSTSTTDINRNRLGVNTVPKPFHFVTSERAAQDASSSFQEKLSLWKKKDKISTITSYNSNTANTKKRKADQQSTSSTTANNNNNNKHAKYI